MVYAERLSQCGRLNCRLNFHPLSGYHWKWWPSHQVLAHEASAFNTQYRYSKLDAVKTTGTHGKINAIWWNIKITVQRLALGRYVWIWIANKFTEFQAKILNRNENIPKSFRGVLFLKHPAGKSLGLAYAQRTRFTDHRQIEMRSQ